MDLDGIDIIDFYDVAEEEIDIPALMIGIAEEKKRRAENENNRDIPKKRQFQPRKTYVRKDPTTSQWYKDYCEDVNNTWRDVNHRDGKLFRQRFFLDYNSITDMVKQIELPENYF